MLHHPLQGQPTAAPTDVRVNTPFIAARKRNYALARERMKAAYPDAPAHLMRDLVHNAATLLAADEVSGRAKGRGL